MPVGALVVEGGAAGAQTWFDDLHRNLHLGATGRYYSELAASWLWVVVLWLRRQAGKRRGAARRLLLPDLTAGKGVRRTRGWHAATWLWLAGGLLILSANGLTWSRYAGGHFSDLLDAAHSSRPAVTTTIEAPTTGSFADTPSRYRKIGTGFRKTAVVDLGPRRAHRRR